MDGMEEWGDEKKREIDRLGWIWENWVEFLAVLALF